MNNAELLKNARNEMLKLHKNMLDHERSIYEGINGKKTPTEFLNLLLEDPDFAWLRKFSTLIVEVDEMFAQKDGYDDETVDALLANVKRLVNMEDEGEDFKAKYQSALQQDIEAASNHGNLRSLLFDL